MDKEFLVRFTKLFAEYVISICSENDCDRCIFVDYETHTCIFVGLPFQWEIV